MIHSAREYANRGNDFRLLLVGEGYAKEELIKLAEEKGLADKVIFTGPVYDRDALKKSTPGRTFLCSPRCMIPRAL